MCYKRIRIALGILLCPLYSFTQNFDTLTISSDIHAVVSFPEDIKQAEAQCGKSDYRLDIDHNELTVSRGEKKYHQGDIGCIITVGEGTRKHSLLVALAPDDAELDPKDAFHDYHTLALMNERLQRVKVGQAQRVAAAEPNHSESGSEYKVIQTSYTPPQEQTQQVSAASQSESDSISFGDARISRKTLEKMVVANITSFQQHVEALANRPSNARSLIDNAMHLFNDDESKIVQITTKDGGIKARQVKVYLTNLTQLPFSHVKVTFSNIQFISKFQKHPDGTWWGTVYLQQKFTASDREGKSTLVDITNKSVEIMVKFYEETKDGQTKSKVRIFLGNIGVAEQA